MNDSTSLVAEPRATVAVAAAVWVQSLSWGESLVCLCTERCTYMLTVGTKCRCTRNQQSELSANSRCCSLLHRQMVLRYSSLRTLSNLMSVRSSDRVHCTTHCAATRSCFCCFYFITWLSVPAMAPLLQSIDLQINANSSPLPKYITNSRLYVCVCDDRLASTCLHIYIAMVVRLSHFVNLSDAYGSIPRRQIKSYRIQKLHTKSTSTMDPAACQHNLRRTE